MIRGDALPSVDALRSLFRYEPGTGRIVRLGACGDGRAGYRTNRGYRSIRISGHRVLEHRVVWALVHGAWPVDQIDHLNGDRADNRIENLREATSSENMRNRSIARNNTSGFKGVYFHKTSGMFRARVKRNGVHEFDEAFSTAQEAAVAYNAAASKIFGRFARLNDV